MKILNNTKFNIKLNWKEIKLIPVYLLMLYFLFVIFIYLKQDFSNNLSDSSTYIIIFLWLMISLISMLEAVKIRSFFKKYARGLNYIVLLLAPIASFLIVELMVSNYNLDMFRFYSVYNLIWYVILYYLVFALTRSCRYTIAICNILVYIASMVNYFVYLFRGNPILPSDLLAWKTGMSVASGYDVSFTRGFLVATLVMYFVFVLGFKLEKAPKKPSAVNRLIVFGTYLLFSVIVFHEFFNTDLIQSKIRVLDFFAPKYTYCSYGTVFGFVANVQAMETEAPQGYSVKKVDNLLKKSEEKKENNKKSETKENPNIIVIMNEAFSDLSLVGDFKTNMDYLPNIRSLSKNTTKGSLYVSVFGGATSDTEYEFLTGNSMAVMPQNCVPYQQFVTDSRDSLATTLKSQGYYNIAIHPYEPSGYKRDLVYPLMGFDEFLSMEDFSNPTKIRNFISDKDSYQKIIEQYETKGKNQPLFIFNVTMQNHGGYSGTRLFNDENTVRLTDYPGHPNVEQYLSLLRESDKAYKTLIDYFAKQKEHTVILLFGDHQPVVYSELEDSVTNHEYQPGQDQLMRKYVVPYVLWSNYDMPKDDVNKMSANYLSSYLLKKADLKGTAYNQYLLDLYQKVPVINSLFYIDKNNLFHSFSESNSYMESINQYKNIGYNNALDKKNRLAQYYFLK